MPGTGQKRFAVRRFVLLLSFICAVNPAHAEELFFAKVIAVMDGDTILVLRENNPPFKVRLANIDAPEKAQEYGLASRRSLIELVLRQQVEIRTRAVDSYGRIVAIIFVADRNINQEQVARGMAWANTRSRDKDMLVVQAQAQQAKRGLWAQDNPLRPRAWRDLHMVRPQLPEQPYTCGSKHYCRQMGSCAEAKFYWMSCSVKSLDSDGDGLPCERLCLAEKRLAE